MQDPRSYFAEHNLFNWDNLKSHAEHHGVYVNTSEQFPNLAILQYKDEVQWGDKPWTAFARMSRGLVVDMKNQAILAHPYEKFFNLGQVPETQYDILKDEHSFEASEKLDGSMLISFLNPNDGQVYLTTKGSFNSEHGKVGTELFNNLPIHFYNKAVEYAKKGTLMFELLDSRFRIVIDYRKKYYQEGLYLIGYRTQEGRLLTYAEVAELAAQLSIPCPKTYQFESLDHLLKKVDEMTVLEEGFVLRYPSGLMVKIKGPAYLKAHRFISQLSDRHILEAVAEGIADPLIEIAPEEYRQDVIEKIAYFKQRKLDLLNQCYQYYHDAPKDDGRKEFALWVQSRVPAHLKGCMFQLFDCKPLKDTNLYDIISKYEDVSTETRI